MQRGVRNNCGATTSTARGTDDEADITDDEADADDDEADIAGRGMSNTYESVSLYGKLSQLRIRGSHATHICNTCNRTLEESQ